MRVSKGDLLPDLMRRAFAISLILSALAACSIPATAQVPSVVVRYREAADVFEMLDQVSAWWPEYVEPAYRLAWTDAHLLQPDDSAFFARYAELRARHFDRTGQDTNGSFRGGSALFTSRSTLAADPVASAFYRSDSLPQALELLHGTLSVEETDFLRAFYAHFASRTSVLAAQTRSLTDSSRTATARTLEDPGVEQYLSVVSALFAPASERSDGRASFTALYVWWPDTNQTAATPNGSAFVLRVRPRAGEVVNSADVVAHETIHVFAARMSEARQQSLSGALLDGCHAPASLRRLAILEEPIATALGNIEFRRRFMPQRFSWSRRWYGDAWVNVYARLLQPVLAERLITGVALDARFASDAAALCTALASTPK